MLSLPAWGVWIEISRSGCPGGTYSHSPHGECGLKSTVTPAKYKENCHSPHGECGLKLSVSILLSYISSHSPHGECGLKSGADLRKHVPVRHSPHGECGLKYDCHDRIAPLLPSLPAWGVWIEIPSHKSKPRPVLIVTPRMGSVD